MSRRMSPLQQGKYNDNIWGFDIETYGPKNKFYCGSIYKDDDIKYMFYNKDDMIDFFRKKMFWRGIIGATNLSFDFWALFWDTDENRKFRYMSRGSDMLTAKTYIEAGQYTHPAERKNKNYVKFIDTMNYARMSVASAGQIIGEPKLNKPACLGRKPRTKTEKEELAAYNMQDSKISQKFLVYLFSVFRGLGASQRDTIASTAMSLWRNKYQDRVYYTHPQDTILDIFKGYYGGRTEAFARGKIKNYGLYDVNSLYPAMMTNEYPDPNTVRHNYSNSLRYIENFEGMSLVTVHVPKTHIPPLPFRYQSKLIFPCGTFTGWQSHPELREAIDMGADIIRVHEGYWYKDICWPFADYVRELYSLRKQYQEDGDETEFAVKLLLNSLYGKFAQKFWGRTEMMPEPPTAKELHQYDKIERCGDFFRVEKGMERPPVFSQPIWSSYVTAYARLHMRDLIRRYDAVYTDTDSIVTKKHIDSSSALGKLKKEGMITKGVIVKPKFYGFRMLDGDRVKLKGAGRRMTLAEFDEMMRNPTIIYKKFAKLRESIRRGLSPNQAMKIEKHFSLEDDKREWNQPFSAEYFQLSDPIILRDGRRAITRPAYADTSRLSSRPETGWT